MFRRPPPRRPPLGRRPPKALRQAHQLKDAGDVQAAAPIFERLAKGAEQRHIERAPFLYLQAAHCYLLAGDNQRGVGLTSHALRLLAREGRWTALYRAGTRAIQIIQEHGLEEVAGQMQTWLDEQLLPYPEARLTPSGPPPASPGSQPLQLPEKCPYCGASLRSDQVLWIDQQSAECTYCGSSVRAA